MTVAAPPAAGSRLHTLPIDLGVAAVVLIALALGLGLRAQNTGRTTTFQDKNSPLRVSYPASWGSAMSLQEGALLKVEDPLTSSAFKTNLTVETRDLDLASPPDLPSIVNRRIDQHAALTAYTLLGSVPTTIDGVAGQMLTYSYVARPLDAPQLDALPVVVVAREDIVIDSNRTTYITMAAPEVAAQQANDQFNAIIDSVKIK